MKELFRIFIDRFGWFGFIRLFFYPVTVLVTTPIRLVQTLWNCRILLKGKWQQYNHFIPFNGLDTLFYWSCAVNLHRFGRRGFSPYLGNGNYPLSRWFHHSIVSLYFYWKASTITILVGMFCWAFSHMIWLPYVEFPWLAIVISFAVISTTFYGNTFALQNYNVLGWMFFPVGLYALLTGNWVLAAGAWFLSSFGSFTVIFLGSIISIIIAVENKNIGPVLSFIPVLLEITRRFYFILSHKDLKSSILDTMKGIGMYRKNVKYKIKVFTSKNNISTIYFLFIYSQFLIVNYYVSQKLSFIFIAGLVIFIANATYIRFADIQSMQMFILSLATVEFIHTQDIKLLVSYWVLAAPLPALIPFPFMGKVLDVVPQVSPFYIKRLIDDMGVFLSSVKPGEKILMAFEDPQGLHSNTFEGYRALLELPLYVAVKNKIHLIPDFWGVNELNYKDSPDFWGRDIQQVLKNGKYWETGYVIIYQNTGIPLDSKWERNGFQILNKFSWADYNEELRGQRPYLKEIPDWWLLRMPEEENF